MLAVFKAAGEAVEKARRGLGPTLIECLTYRQGGHSRGDPATYRPKEEVKQWLKKDPVARFKTRLLERRIMTEEEATRIEKEVAREIEKATRYAKESSFPRPASALEDIYA